MSTPAKREVKWLRILQGNDDVRHRLYVDGEETPYFIDVAAHRAHFSYGERISLWGAGLGEETRAGFRLAGFFGGFDKLSDAKGAAVSLITPPTPAVEFWEMAEVKATR